MKMTLRTGRCLEKQTLCCLVPALWRVGETWQLASPAVVVATPEAAFAIPDLPFS